MRQEEAVASSWISGLTLIFASYVARLNNKMIQISTHYHKLVFVLRKCSKTLLQQLMQNSKTSPGVTLPRFQERGGESLFSFFENVLINSPTAMQISQIFPGVIPPDPSGVARAPRPRRARDAEGARPDEEWSYATWESLQTTGPGVQTLLAGAQKSSLRYCLARFRWGEGRGAWGGGVASSCNYLWLHPS